MEDALLNSIRERDMDALYLNGGTESLERCAQFSAMFVVVILFYRLGFLGKKVLVG